MISRTSNSSPAAARQWQLFGKKQLGRSLPVGQFSTTRIDSDRHRRTSITRCNITGKAKTTHSSSWEAQCIKMLLCHFIVWPGGHWHWHWRALAEREWFHCRNLHSKTDQPPSLKLATEFDSDQCLLVFDHRRPSPCCCDLDGWFNSWGLGAHING